MSWKLLHPQKVVKHEGEKPSVISTKGQTFLEFILLLLVLVSLSFITLRGFNSSIADRWTAIIKVIAKPSPSTIELR